MSLTPYYQDASVTIYHGDCREILPSLHGVNAVISDPPYALPTQVAAGRSNVSNLGDLSIAEFYFKGLITELWKLVGNTGQIFLFCDATFYPVLFRAAYGRPGMALLVWDKGQIGMGREFRKSHELILRLWGEDAPTVSDGVGRPDVLHYPPVPVAQRVHPAEKPVSLLTALMWCVGQVILDPYMGSGSTLRAAKDLGRKAIGIDIEERNCEIAARRMGQEVFQFAATGD